jgi:hypothetical protein
MAATFAGNPEKIACEKVCIFDVVCISLTVLIIFIHSSIFYVLFLRMLLINFVKNRRKLKAKTRSASLLETCMGLRNGTLFSDILIIHYA